MMPSLTQDTPVGKKGKKNGERRACTAVACNDRDPEDPPMAKAKTAPKSRGGKGRTSEHVDRMFRAFCDRTRLRILSLLRDGELCVGDIVEILQVPQPRVSRHLGHLKKAGLVTARKSGTWIHYTLTPPQTAFHRKLLDCAITCFQEVPEIQADSARAARAKKHGGCCPHR
jgi:ArsR family transcriptional regulator